MSAHPPTLRPARLLPTAAIVVLCLVATAAPATALPVDFAGSALRGLAAWFAEVGGLVAAGDPTPPNAGTCIDPNGKPRPCEVAHLVPSRTGHGRERSVPRLDGEVANFR